MQKLSKEQKIGIGVSILALILIIIVIAKNNTTETDINTNANDSMDMATTTPTSTPAMNSNTNKPAVKTTTGKTYEAKVKQYEGHRFQINDSCQVFPANATFANNTAVMFDNRSAIDRVISLSGRDFTVKAKGWIEMKLTSKIIPNTINVSCGSAYNVAKILLQ